MAVTRIKNNQITNATVVASAKLVSGSVTGGLLSNPLNYSGDFTITGNLTVNGTTTTVDTTNTLVADPVIVLSRGETGTPSNDSGFLVERGTSNNAAFLWDETNDQFVAITTTSDGLTGGAITQTAFANLKVSNVIATVGTTLGNIAISGNDITSTNSNGNINITPNGTGDINLGADSVVVGDSNTQAIITTNGTGNLLLSTNSGTNSGNIVIVQGTNGNINLTPNGTGQIVSSSVINATRFVSNIATGTAPFTVTSTTQVANLNVATAGTAGTVTTAAQPNITSVGTLTSLGVSGAVTASTFTSNVATGTAPLVVTSTTQVANLNVAASGTAVTVTAAAQPNITSVGNLTIANIDNIQIDANTISSTSGNLVLSPTANILINNATANRVLYAGANKELLTSANFTFDGTNTVLGGDLGINGGDITTTSTTFTLANANATTINIGGAATAVNIGATTGTTIIKNNLDVDGTINMDGASFTTTAATVSLMNANTTTINFGGAATTLEIGAATGTTNINNNLDVDGNINLDGGNFTTTAATVNIANANSTTLNIGGAATTVNIGATTGTTIIKNDLQINGNDIKSSTGNVAITMNNTDVTIAGNLTVQGATTNVGTQDLIVQDSLINLHTTANLAPLTVDDGRDVGIIFHYYKTSDKEAALVWANDTSALEYYVDATETVSGTITGTYGNIKASTFISNVSTGTAPFTVNSTTLVANLRAATSSIANTVNDAAQPNITSVGTLTSLGVSGAVTASTFTSNVATGTAPFTVTSTTQVANLNVAASGTAVTVTAAAQPNITSVGNLTIANVDNIQIDGNTISSTDTNGNVNITPNGTGDINLGADTVVVGDSNTQAVITTNGTGNLFLSTNSGTNSGNIIIGQGTNANITITSNGTGNIVLDNLAINDATLISTQTNANITLTPNGTGDVVLSADTVTVGDSNAEATITTNGTGNLTLSTNGGTNSGTILIQQGANANITMTPNGTGDVVLSADTVVVGDSGAAATITSNGTGNLTLNTNSGTNSGTVTIVQGTNGNITLTPNGTGEVVASTLAVSDLTSGRVTYASTAGALIDNANLTFSGTLLTVTGSANVSSQANIGNINVNGNTISSIDTNGNINITANGTGYVIVNSSADSSDFIINGNTTVSASYANLFYVKSSTGQIGIGTNSPASNVLIDMDAFTTSVLLPKGTTGQRPSGDEVEGMLRYNMSTHFYEFWNGTAWTSTTGSYTVIAADSFSGDSSTLAFTLSQSATSAGVIVSINGVVQIPGTAYGVSGTTLTFTEAPLTGDSIDVRILTTTTTVTQIADLNTSFTVSDSAERANVAINGNLLVSVSNAAVLPGSDNLYHLGSGALRWKNVYATNTTIQNADLAENYLADMIIEAGTVVSFGGLNEVTTTTADMDSKVAGVVSTSPAHIMNSGLEGEFVVPIALQGRTPVKVTGPVNKGDMMVSAGNGRARAEENPKLGSVIGKALENHPGGEGIIEVVVGRL